MHTDSGMTGISPSGFMPYMTVASLEMSDEPKLVQHFKFKIVMTNLEKYNNVFVENLQVSEDQLATLKYQGVELWDSVGHMTLVAALEDAFDIMMDTDDIIDLSSYEKGKEILKKYDVEI